MPTIVGIIAFGLSFFAVQHFFFGKPSFDKSLAEVSSQINKTCPIMIDEDTQLDNTLALPNKMLAYNYTLVNLEKQNIDIDEFQNFIELNAINNMKTNPEMKLFRENKVTMIYNYNDKNKEFIIKINISPEKYE